MFLKRDKLQTLPMLYRFLPFFKTEGFNDAHMVLPIDADLQTILREKKMKITFFFKTSPFAPPLYDFFRKDNPKILNI